LNFPLVFSSPSAGLSGIFPKAMRLAKFLFRGQKETENSGHALLTHFLLSPANPCHSSRLSVSVSGFFRLASPLLKARRANDSHAQLETECRPRRADGTGLRRKTGRTGRSGQMQFKSIMK